MQPLADDEWEAWTPDDLAVRFADLAVPWYVTGGWALDLWHGRLTRQHGDLEFATLPEGIGDCRARLGDLDHFVARDGTLTYLPHGARPPDDLTQIWMADMRARRWRVDMMVERGTEGTWRYKRDPTFCLPRADSVRRTPSGLPYLAPALVLLFKARHRRDKDERDFETALPRLAEAERTALSRWLGRFHPGHGWIRRLES